MDDKPASATSFDAFDFIGLVAPGLIFNLGCRVLFPEVAANIPQSSFSIGDLGILATVAFATGHLLQGLGNILESAIWLLLGGWPTEKLLLPTSRLLTEPQKTKIRSQLLTSSAAESRKLAGSEVRAMYVAIARSASTSRIDKFGRNYVFARGLVSCLALLFLLYGAVGAPTKLGVILLLLGTVLAVGRMHRVASQYARELGVTFLSL